MANITELSQELFTRALAAPTGLATTAVTGSNRHLKQILVALRAGHSLTDHPNPGEASVVVLTGSVELGPAQSAVGAGTEFPPITGQEGDVLTVPAADHYLKAHTDALVLLSVVRVPR